MSLKGARLAPHGLSKTKLHLDIKWIYFFPSMHEQKVEISTKNSVAILECKRFKFCNAAIVLSHVAQQVFLNIIPFEIYVILYYLSQTHFTHKIK